MITSPPILFKGPLPVQRIRGADWQELTFFNSAYFLIIINLKLNIISYYWKTFFLLDSLPASSPNLIYSIQPFIL